MESELAHVKCILREILQDIQTGEQEIQSYLASVETMRWEHEWHGDSFFELQREILRKHYEAFRIARFRLWLIKEKIEGLKP